MKRIRNYLLVALVASMFTLTSTAQTDSAKIEETSTKTEINWLSFEEAFEMNKSTPKNG